MIRHSLVFIPCSLVVTGFCLGNPYSGDWRVFKYDAPSRWIEGYYNSETATLRQSTDQNDSAQAGETLVDIFYPEAPEAISFDITIAAGGAVAGDVTGTSSADYERLSISADGENLSFVTPLNGDIGIALEKDSDIQSLLTMVRRSPSDILAAEVEGTWRLVLYSLPARLVETFQSGGTPETYQLRYGADDQDFAQPGEQLVDVNFSEAPETVTGTITLASGGGLTGNVTGGPVSGAWSINNPNGTVSFSIDGDVRVVTPTPNRELLAGTFTDSGVREMVFLVKDGPVPTLDELAGPWRLAVFGAPMDIVKTGPGLVDAYFSSDYDARFLPVHISRTGGLTVGAESGAAAIAGDGIAATLADRTYFLLPTPSRDVMVGVFAETDPQADTREIECFIMTKQARLELEIGPTEVAVDWTGLIPVELQRWTGSGDWETVQTVGPNSRLLRAKGQKEFFRVAVP